MEQLLELYIVFLIIYHHPKAQPFFHHTQQAVTIIVRYQLPVLLIKASAALQPILLLLTVRVSFRLLIEELLHNDFPREMPRSRALTALYMKSALSLVQQL